VECVFFGHRFCIGEVNSNSVSDSVVVTNVGTNSNEEIEILRKEIEMLKKVYIPYQAECERYASMLLMEQQKNEILQKEVEALKQSLKEHEDTLNLILNNK